MTGCEMVMERDDSFPPLLKMSRVHAPPVDAIVVQQIVDLPQTRRRRELGMRQRPSGRQGPPAGMNDGIRPPAEKKPLLSNQPPSPARAGQRGTRAAPPGDDLAINIEDYIFSMAVIIIYL